MVMTVYHEWYCNDLMHDSAVSKAYTCQGRLKKTVQTNLQLCRLCSFTKSMLNVSMELQEQITASKGLWNHVQTDSWTDRRAGGRLTTLDRFHKLFFTS